jgi:hypothetical protein
MSEQIEDELLSLVVMKVWRFNLSHAIISIDLCSDCFSAAKKLCAVLRRVC